MTSSDFYQGKQENEIQEELKNTYKEDDIRTACKEIQELKDAGMLFTEDIYRNAIEHFKERETVVKALCLHIAHDCNLACRDTVLQKRENTMAAEP